MVFAPSSIHALFAALMLSAQVSTVALQGSTLVLGNVTLFNMPAPRAGTTKALPTSRLFCSTDVWLSRSGPVPCSVITVRDPTSSLSVTVTLQVTSPAESVGPVGPDSWQQSIAAQQQRQT
jgi:hypothetical protein